MNGRGTIAGGETGTSLGVERDLRNQYRNELKFGSSSFDVELTDLNQFG